jgi:hypothetical protein
VVANPGDPSVSATQYSQRSAAMGSMARALRAGTMQASAATGMSGPEAAKTMIGSRVPLSIQRAMTRFRPRLSARPATIPKPLAGTSLRPGEGRNLGYVRNGGDPTGIAGDEDFSASHAR